jgi:predicted membrane-bound spermidine synthase
VNSSQANRFTGTRATLYVCFLLSGCAGLVYEVLWAKYLALYLGSTGLAHIIVLSTFMGGLAIGSQVWGRAADRTRTPLKLYVYLEFTIGAYALVFEPVFGLTRSLFLAIVNATQMTPGGLLGAVFAGARSGSRDSGSRERLSWPSY